MHESNDFFKIMLKFDENIFKSVKIIIIFELIILFI